MRVWTCCVAALLAVGTALTASAPGTAACMTIRPFGVRAPLFLLVTAGADTVRAGPGPIGYNAGNTDPDSLAAIHGQRFRLDRAGGDVPAELAGVEGGEAVLVPYGWECGDTWMWREARWATPGSQVVVDATLRPRGQWADGLPTFDVEVAHDVYPPKYADADPGADALSPAQVFHLYGSLPTWAEVEADTAAAYRAFLHWAAANPALAARYPATNAMDEAQEWLQPCVPAYDPHPAAGTYRVQVVVRQTDTLNAFFRTDSRGYPMCRPPVVRLDLASVRPRLADTARLYVHGAADEAAIPETNPEANAPGSCSVAIVDVVNQTSTDAEGRRSWRADYNFPVLPGCFPGHPGVKQAVDAIARAYSPEARADEPGWFREAPGDGMRFEQRWSVDGRVMLEVRATRTGTRTLRDYGG